MADILTFDTVAKYNAYNNHETLHPLIGFNDLSKAKTRQHVKMNMGIYCIVLKDVDCGDVQYGRETYDYREGTLMFFAPGQVVSIGRQGEFYEPKGYALVFHPDLLHGTALGNHIQDYNFFSYKINEALHISERERKTVLECFSKIETELHQSIDKHSKRVIVSTLELFLNYCLRFYDRQFITREKVHHSMLERFESLLNDYYLSDKPQTLGLPTVGWCASELNLSANYFGDLVKKETGKSALEYIQSKVIDVAKERIFDTTKSASEIAYELGFKYPQHFSRLFRQRVGYSPNEYRTLN